MTPDRSSSPTLTVVLPNYNHAALIERALAALLTQDSPPDEIIILDDASTDGSLSVIEGCAARNSSIRVLTNPRNLGVIRTLQKGLASAEGRYVYFAAADDWVLPQFFTLALRLLEAYPQRGFFCGEAILVDGDSGRFLGYRPVARPRRREGEVTPSRARQLLGRIDNWILTGSTVFRRDRIIAAGGFDERLGAFADSYLARKVALTNGFCYAPVPVATWCVFRGSYSRTAALHDAGKLLQVIPAVIAADPAFPVWYADLFRRRWRFATSRLALASDPVDASVLRSMGAISRLDRMALDLILAVSPRSVGRFAALAMLWLRLRPTSLTRVLATAAARRVARFGDAARTTKYRGSIEQ